MFLSFRTIRQQAARFALRFWPANLSSVKNELQVERNPKFSRDFFAQLKIGIVRSFCVREPESVRHAENVPVNRKCGNFKSLRQNHACGFSSDTGEGLQLFKRSRNFASEFFD